MTCDIPNIHPARPLRALLCSYRPPAVIEPLSHDDCARNLPIEPARRSMTKSTSSFVLRLPNENRSEELANLSGTPRARRTYDDSRLALVQAEPVLTAMSFIAKSNSS